MNRHFLLLSITLALISTTQLESRAQPRGQQSELAKLNFLRGLTNTPPPAPGLHQALDEDGLPLIDPISAAMDSTIRSNLAFYATMDHGRIINLQQIRATEYGAIAD